MLIAKPHRTSDAMPATSLWHPSKRYCHIVQVSDGPIGPVLSQVRSVAGLLSKEKKVLADVWKHRLHKIHVELDDTVQPDLHLPGVVTPGLYEYLEFIPLSDWDDRCAVINALAAGFTFMRTQVRGLVIRTPDKIHRSVGTRPHASGMKNEIPPRRRRSRVIYRRL